jgi:hypothetical protein
MTCVRRKPRCKTAPPFVFSQSSGTQSAVSKGSDDIYKRMKGVAAHHTIKPTYWSGCGMGLSRCSGATVSRYAWWASMNMSSTSNQYSLRRLW